jgi:hypothetical protein
MEASRAFLAISCGAAVVMLAVKKFLEDRLRLVEEGAARNADNVVRAMHGVVAFEMEAMQPRLVADIVSAVQACTSRQACACAVQVRRCACLVFLCVLTGRLPMVLHPRPLDRSRAPPLPVTSVPHLIVLPRRTETRLPLVLLQKTMPSRLMSKVQAPPPNVPQDGGT